jgi:hypothetical protein
MPIRRLIQASGLLRARLRLPPARFATCVLLSLATLHAPPSAIAVGVDGYDTGRSVCLLLRDGRWISTRLERFTNDSLEFSTAVAAAETGVVAPAVRSDILACVVGGFPRSMTFMTAVGASSIVFSDGQLLPGVIQCESKQCALEHKWLGRIPLEIERLSEIRVDATRRAPARLDSDMLLLSNGDTIGGFVLSLGEEISLETTEQSGEGPSAEPAEQPKDPPSATEGAGPATRRLRMERIAAIAFAATTETTSANPIAWTSDGTIMRVADVALDPVSGWACTPAMQDVGVSGSNIVITESMMQPKALLFDRGALIPLAACGTPRTLAPESSYRFEQSPEIRVDPPEQALLGLGEIALTGPTRLQFGLPERLIAAARPSVFTCEVALREPAPADARLSVEIRYGGMSTGSVVLDASRRRAAVRLEWTAKRGDVLEISVTDGGNGVAGDQLVLERACFVQQR